MTQSNKEIPEGLKKWVAEYIMMRRYGNMEQAQQQKKVIDKMIERDGLDKNAVYFVFGDPDNPDEKEKIMTKVENFLKIYHL